MKINILSFIFLVFISFVTPANEMVDVNKIHESFVDAAQGHALNSILDMSGISKIIGTKSYDKIKKQYHLDFPKLAPGNGVENSQCYIGLDVAGKPIGKAEVCTITAATGKDFLLGQYEPPLWLYPKFTTTGFIELKLKSGVKNAVIAPGDYWISKLVLDGVNISVSGKGTANIYVKEGVVINDKAQVGTLGSPINIINYKHDFEINNGSTLFGNIKTKDNLIVNGESKISLLGEVEAVDLILNATALAIGVGNHWFEKLKINNKSSVSLVGDGFTVFNVKDAVEIDNSNINYSTADTSETKKSLLILQYKKIKEDKIDIKVEGGSKVRAYLYTRNDLRLNSSTIYGAVNVGDLIMNTSTIQYDRLFYNESDTVHHYQLSYDPLHEQVSAIACKDNLCNEVSAQQIARLNISETINNIVPLVSFAPFTGQSAPVSILDNAKTCMRFAINKETDTLPVPTGVPALQCFIGNNPLVDCKICDEAIPLYGYVQGEAIIPTMPDHAEQLFTIANYKGTPGLFSFPNNSKLLGVGDKITLPLSVSHSQAGKLTLTLNDKDGRHYEVTLGFVPKQLVWAQALTDDACGDLSSAFIYSQHAASCKALVQAGSPIMLTIQANDINGNKINNYIAELGDIAAVLQLNDQHQGYEDDGVLKFPVNFIANSQHTSQISFTPNKVGLIKASLNAHTSPYGKLDNGLTALITDGSSSVLGRSVPASFQVSGIAGEIKNGVAYRSKEIEFETLPHYKVIACSSDVSAGCKALPSYAGQFALGLNKLGNLTFSATESGTNGPVTLTNPQSATVSIDSGMLAANKVVELGSHIIEPSDALGFIFTKEAPAIEQSIEQALTLSVQIPEDAVPNQTAPKGHGNAALDDTNAQLRYGFLKIFDLELATNTVGLLPLHLKYYGTRLDNIERDSATDLGISDSSAPFQLNPNTGELKAEHLSFIKHGVQIKDVQVSKQVNPWEGDIELTVPKWLKVFDDLRCTNMNCLVNPSGHLLIKDQASKRGYDRIFNRREVVR